MSSFGQPEAQGGLGGAGTPEGRKEGALSTPGSARPWLPPLSREEGERPHEEMG